MIYLGYHTADHADAIEDVYGETVVGRHSYDPYEAAKDALPESGKLYSGRREKLRDQMADHHGDWLNRIGRTHSEICERGDGSIFVVLRDPAIEDDEPGLQVLKHGLDPTRRVICPECGGEGGMHGFTGGYTVHGSGYGDCYQNEGWIECDTCGGYGDLEIAELLEGYEMEKIVEWYGDDEHGRAA
ncbi:MAG: hypothetical protein ABEN55_13405 [Bradymonadaceae bacterium]